MSAHEAWLSTTGANHNLHNSPLSHPRNLYDRTYWDRLAEPSIFLPFLVLLATILYSSRAFDIPASFLSPPFGVRLWNAIVTATPASVLFAIDDWLSPFPLPRQPFDRLAPAAAHDAKSNALARILGRGPDGAGVAGAGRPGILASVSFAGKTGLSRLMPKGDTDRPAGLGNLSNSCYQNSILQALSSLVPLRDYLAWIMEEEEVGDLPLVQTAHTLGELVQDLYGPTKNGETLWTPPVLKRMSTFQQQDAQEYFCKLLNEVQEEVEKALKSVQRRPGFETDISLEPQPDVKNGSLRSEDSGYHSTSSSSATQAATVASSFRIPLEGLVAQRIVCQSCGYSSGLSMNPFYCLTLNLGFGSSEYRLEDTLDSFSAVENIEGVQCASCTLLKFQSRIRTIIGRIEAASGEGPEETRLKQPVPYERLEAIEAALEDEDFEEKTLADKCKIPDKQRIESTKSRQVGIARAPPSIAFHINRSRFDESTGYTFKNPAAVRFPLHLDLGPWCLGSAASRVSPSEDDENNDDMDIEGNEKNRDDSSLQHAPPAQPTEEGEQWQLPAQLPMVAGTQHNSRITGPMYELRAVITHYGQHENGHYVCYRKHPVVQHPLEEEKESETKGPSDSPPNLASEATSGEDIPLQPLHSPESGETAADAENAEDEMPNASEETQVDGPQWWRLSDQNVYPSDEASVLSQGGVFMLFYDRIEANSVFSTAAEGTSITTKEDVHDTSSDDKDTTSVADSSTLVEQSVGGSDATELPQDPRSEAIDVTDEAAVDGDGAESATQMLVGDDRKLPLGLLREVLIEAQADQTTARS